MKSQAVPSSAVRWVVQCLWLDTVATEAIAALSEAGIPSVLLKGPVTARWLYSGDPGARHYRDVDLLVPPAGHTDAEGVLAGLGFERSRVARLADEVELHGHEWRRQLDGAAVDLHRSLHFLEDVPAELVWRLMTEHTELFEVAGVMVEAPSLPWRTLNVVLHASPEGPPERQSWADLARALEVVDEGLWRQAADLAARLGVEPAMGAGLRLLPPGVGLAERLGLADCPPDRFVLRQAVASPSVRSVARLAELRGRRRLRYVGQKLVPPADFVRQWSPLAARSRA
ncbi:MAG: nucleotidyltransferase family protein, partial [Acidimicrobiales bacterium]